LLGTRFKKTNKRKNQTVRKKIFVGGEKKKEKEKKVKMVQKCK